MSEMPGDHPGARVGPAGVSPRPTYSRNHHRAMLIVAILVVVLSFALTVLPGGERVAFHGAEDYPLPHSCAARSGFGVDCPGCGLTRSFVWLAEGDVSASYASNRVGWMFAAVVLFQIPYRFLVLRHGGRRQLGAALPLVVGISLAVLLLANWIWNLATA